MDYKQFISKLGFIPKDKTVDIYIKKYQQHGGYSIEVNFANQSIDYGTITCESKTTQNFSQPENFVVLECVDRLLIKGYKPKDITLEKTYPSGRGHSGRLDILVKKDKKAFLMIECKTWGKEFDNELKKTHKDGGQLFTYFQNDTNADYLMLYASHLTSGGVKYRCEIIKIEDNYRTAGNVEDTLARWNKLTYSNGIFEDWVNAYEYQNKLLTKKDLVPLTEADSGTIFHGFLSILRKHSVSDKPNAFNKIFNLFLAKIYDEKKRDSDELDFQWKEKEDNPVDFQVRLINLHKKGLWEFLRKEIVGISNDDFECKTAEDLYNKKKERLMFNKIFDIKDVIDDESFDDNFRVLKEVVQLLEKYQIRYPRKQQHLSDFFERLLTTGLKQEAGQYFTPPPITKFIVRSLPIREMIETEANQPVAKLPAVIDYAAGSGHFITEIMEAYQDVINNIDTTDYYPDAQKEVAAWQTNPYSWAAKYVYGVEKDYRLVKVAKVGCYFYGDGLAQVIHGDGLDSFTKSKSYVGLLKRKENEDQEDSSKANFSIVVSNPPYSVDAFKGDLRNIDAGKDFTLYSFLTDKSKEIECLFVERTKQLLRDNGVGGIVLPNSILSNGGIYTKTREIILQNFDIVAITELGSNTFMATGTNTVVLFLRRKNSNFYEKTKNALEESIATHKDNTINEIEKPISKYVGHVWEGITYKDYLTLLKKNPNEAIQSHEVYREYRAKINTKVEADFWNTVLMTETEKILYYIVAFPQKIVLVKTGEKEAEKRFLGYEFSNRRGNEGIHPIQRGKTIEECTQLFDPKTYGNSTKASTYIYKAFEGDYTFPIDESLLENISRIDLVDMLTFDRIDFDKSISISGKKKVKIDTKWDLVKLEDVAQIIRGVTYSKEDQVNFSTSNIILTADNITLDGRLEITKQVYLNTQMSIDEEKRLKTGDSFICFSSGSKQHVGKVAYISADTPYYAGGFMGVIRANNENILPKYLYLILNSSQIQEIIKDSSSGSNINNLSGSLYEVKIPLPPKEIQRKIIAEIETLEKKEAEARTKIDRFEQEIEALFSDAYTMATDTYRLSDNKIFSISIGKRVLTYDLVSKGGIPVYSANVIEPFGNIDKSLIKDFNTPSVLWGIDGDWMVNYIPENTPFYPTDHCGVLRVLSNDISPKYVAWVLLKEGINKRFSRQLRASIDRISSISIKVPSVAKQKEVIAKVEDIEKQLANFRKLLITTQTLKADIVKKYL
ncbi:MAG TPA: restriction endonuclease subunit S [Paludibacteraceae bacterium]|nr:restriction endonuclease subunit S [Paludibacteraceae bacterium]